MSYFKRITLLICLSMAVVAFAADEVGKPSSGAEGMHGVKGTFAFRPDDRIPVKTSWWKDSDGVNPGVAGCHIGTDDQGKPNGRMFGEACLSDKLLVESNPGKDVLHDHFDDVGHPDRFNCNAWCIGNGHKGGACQVAPAPPCKKSAVCACK